MVERKSSENFSCSWSCQEAVREAKRAWRAAARTWTSSLKRFNSLAKRRTSSGSMIA